METVVRMGEGAVSGRAGDVLACIGLGSCIGLALVDRGAGVAALAHVMLPEAPARDVAQPHKYADLAVDVLVHDAVAGGAVRRRLEAALVGGAAMFQLGGGSQDIGARNDAEVRRRLDLLGIPVRATATGGNRGRTIRVRVGPHPTIVAREAGGQEEALLV
jgi:chemotaxis protein CheD